MKENLEYNKVLKKMIKNYLHLDNYKYIMNNLHNTIVSSNNCKYQKVFNSFYKVRKDEKWRKKYYDFLEKHKNEKDTILFEKIIKYLSYEGKEVKSIELSFSSKLLATINPQKPICDKYVLNFFNKKINKKLPPQERLQEAIKIYKEIETQYEIMLKDDETVKTIKKIKELINEPTISDVKILDFIIWSQRDNKKT